MTLLQLLIVIYIILLIGLTVFNFIKGWKEDYGFINIRGLITIALWFIAFVILFAWSIENVNWNQKIF